MENGKSQISFLPAAQNIIIQNTKLNSYKKKFLGLITARHIKALILYINFQFIFLVERKLEMLDKFF